MNDNRFLTSLGLALTIVLFLARPTQPAHAAAPKCGDVPGDQATIEAVLLDAGHSCPCDGFATNAKYVSCVNEAAKAAVVAGRLRKQCKNVTLQAASKSTCSRPLGAVACCKTTKQGKKTCSIVGSPEKCKAPKGGVATTGATTSCRNACAPACNDMAPPEEMVRDATNVVVSSTYQSPVDAYNNLGRVLAQVPAELHCRGGTEASSTSFFAPLLSSTQGLSECQTSYCANADYCGPGDSISNPCSLNNLGNCPHAPQALVGSEINRACFNHDRCYLPYCVDVEEPCYFSGQGGSDGCDVDLQFSIVNQFGNLFDGQLWAKEALFFTIQLLSLKTSADPICHDPPCAEGEQCNAADGICMPEPTPGPSQTPPSPTPSPTPIQGSTPTPGGGSSDTGRAAVYIINPGGGHIVTLSADTLEVVNDVPFSGLTDDGIGLCGSGVSCLLYPLLGPDKLLVVGWDIVRTLDTTSGALGTPNSSPPPSVLPRPPMATSPNGKLVYVGHNNNGLPSAEQYAVSVRSVETWEEVGRLGLGFGGSFRPARYSPAGLFSLGNASVLDLATDTITPLSNFTHPSTCFNPLIGPDSDSCGLEPCYFGSGDTITSLGFTSFGLTSDLTRSVWLFLGWRYYDDASGVCTAPSNWVPYRDVGSVLMLLHGPVPPVLDIDDRYHPLSQTFINDPSTGRVLWFVRAIGGGDGSVYVVVRDEDQQHFLYSAGVDREVRSVPIERAPTLFTLTGDESRLVLAYDVDPSLGNGPETILSFDSKTLQRTGEYTSEARLVAKAVR